MSTVVCSAFFSGLYQCLPSLFLSVILIFNFFFKLLLSFQLTNQYSATGTPIREMGSCMSSDKSDPQSSSTAKVITLKGELHQYNVPVFVSQVLQAESISSSDSFLTNSDGLLYDDYIPALGPDDLLLSDQIYFLLPVSKLQYRLSASDMAALAVKASVAIQNAAKNERCRRKKARISPVLPVEKSRISLEGQTAAKRKSFEQKPGAAAGPNISMTRSGSVRKLQRYTSRRAKLAVRSFRLRLSTIYEGIVV